jgi:hypothetical protein
MGHFSPTPERRQFGRRQTFMHAVISLRGRPSVPCVVRNLSTSGALLEVDRPAWLPARFRVIIEAISFETDCEIVHRTNTGVGDRFAMLAPDADRCRAIGAPDRSNAPAP